MKKSKYKFAITGAVETHDCSLDTINVAKKLGKALAKKGHVVVTGGRHGFPYFTAMGAKSSDGEVLYFSPASNIKEHKEAYRLDTEYVDMFIYTGFGFIGSSVFMTRSADAIIIGCGKLDALHEFSIAIEEKKPIGVLVGDWDTDEMIKKIAGNGNKSHIPVIFEKDINLLISKLEDLIK